MEEGAQKILALEEEPFLKEIIKKINSECSVNMFHICKGIFLTTVVGP